MTDRPRTSFLCPNCRRLLSAGESVCPYCGMKNPSSGFLRLMLAGRHADLDPVRILIGVNAACYLLSLLLNPMGAGFSMNPFTFLSPTTNSLFVLGATGTIPVEGYGRWWTLLTASFLHGGILHIFFNMMALYQLGPFVRQEYGTVRFLLIYLLSGVAGFLVSLPAGIPFTIGASASVCGLIGAILYYGKSRGGFYGQAVYRQAMGWIVGLALFGLVFPGINNWAHGGGIAAGVLIGFLAGYEENRAETAVHRVLSSTVVVLNAAVLAWASVRALYLAFF